MTIARFGAVMPVALFLMLALGGEAKAQDSAEPRSELEILQQADVDIARFCRPVFNDSQRCSHVWLQLTDILHRNPNSELRSRIEQDMLPLEEMLGKQDLAIAEFYLNRGKDTGRTEGAQGRLLNIVKNYPRFSRMDEVLFDLATASLVNDDRDTARDYLLKVVCRYPYSNQTVSAFHQLNEIGFSVWEGCDKFKP